MENRIRGLMIGGALGDALGSPYEFKLAKIEKEYTGKLDSRKQTYNHWLDRTTVYSIGEVTDDTEMSMCILQSLKENKMIYNREDTIMKYIEWANSGTMSMGRNTKDLFKGIKTYSGYKKRHDKKFSDKAVAQKMQSNGAMMRSGLLAIYRFRSKEVWEMILRGDCYITNPSLFAYECNYLLSSSIYDALSGLGREVIMRRTLKRCSKMDSKIVDYMRKASKGEVININGKDKGWCLNALYITYFSLMKGKNFKDSIDMIIRRKGDTDTNGCIAGYLLGAYYGLDEMNKDSVTRENIKILLECDTKDSSKPRPDRYLMKNYYTDQNVKMIVNFIEKKQKNFLSPRTVSVPKNMKVPTTPKAKSPVKIKMKKGTKSPVKIKIETFGLSDIFDNLIIPEPEKKSKIIGSGSYGSVYRPPKECGMPKCDLQKCKTGVGKIFSDRDSFVEEEDFFSHIRGLTEYIYIGNPLSCITTNNEMQLVYEYGGKDLVNYINDNIKEPNKIYGGLMNIFYALYSMNEIGMYHCDIKGENIVVLDQKNGLPLMRMIDFGLSYHTSMDEDIINKNPYDTLSYMFPPESVYLNSYYSKHNLDVNNYKRHNHSVILDPTKLKEMQDKLLGMSLKERRSVIFKKFDFYMLAHYLLLLNNLYRKEVWYNDVQKLIIKMAAVSVFDRIDSDEACLEYFDIVEKHFGWKREVQVYRNLIKMT